MDETHTTSHESPDARAAALVAQMTPQEKFQLIHGLATNPILGFFFPPRAPKRSVGGVGFGAGIPRLGIPDLTIVDSGNGLVARGRLTQPQTIFPAPLALAATWNRALAAAYGDCIGKEARAAGFNVALGGTVNLVREPRGGRVFETHGEDPLLAGELIAPLLRAVQAQGVIANIKHFALNDQETGRYGYSANLNEKALRESDLLAFELGIEKSNVGMVMSAYNRLNGQFASENAHLLTEVLKTEWGFKGFVISDWGANRSAAPAARAGLDQEQPFGLYFGRALRRAVRTGQVPQVRIDDMVRRILRTLFAVGATESPASTAFDATQHKAVAQRVAEESLVLLKNAHSVLPLDSTRVRSIAVIGGHADRGVLSGGGSSRIIPEGGSTVPPVYPRTTHFDPMLPTSPQLWLPSVPLEALRAHAPEATIHYADGTDMEKARALAAQSDVAVVFAHQWRTEGADLDTLTLPGKQDALIAAVAQANSRTVVVLETGGAALLPWHEQVSAIIAAWYPGERGAEAIARVLFGQANPSGKLPITFPRNETQLPKRKVPALRTFGLLQPLLKYALWRRKFAIDYNDEGARVGYKWYESTQQQPLFSFGHGLSYTQFAYRDLTVERKKDVTVRFTIENVGDRAGAEVAQVYVRLPEVAGERHKRLAGWCRVLLEPGAQHHATVLIDPRLLSIFDPKTHAWHRPAGIYSIEIGSSSVDIRLSAEMELLESPPQAL